METHPLTLALESWPGRKPSQLAFEARGFAIHKAWQERIIRFCGEQQERLLNRYWDEVALETMQSLGQGERQTKELSASNQNIAPNSWTSYMPPEISWSQTIPLRR